MDNTKRNDEAKEQKVVEDRQTLLSVLLELTVATSKLFDPTYSMCNFLESIAERLGCSAVICIEMTLGEIKDVKLIEAVGLSQASRKHPPLQSSNINTNNINTNHKKIGAVEPLLLDYRELKNQNFKQWNFAIPIEGSEKDPGPIYYLQLYFSSAVEPKQQYHGMIERLLFTLRNALEHRRLYQKTLEQKTLLEVQIDCTMDGILIISADKRVRFVNQRFFEMWGFTPEINSEIDKSALAIMLTKVRSPKQVFFEIDEYEINKDKIFQSQLTLSDGHIFDYFSFPITAQNGINYGRGWYFRDITESKKGERERALLLKREILARSQAESERKQIAKALGIRDDFISIASHELKTPITSLRMQLQLIRSELKKYETGQLNAEKFCENIFKKLAISEQQVERLIVLVFGLLDVSKIQAGKLSLEKREVNLSNLVLESIIRFQDQFKSSGNEIKLSIEPDVIGYWDPFRIEQVINNLIVNAIKYGNSKPIEIHLKKTNDLAHLTVKDYGPGIKKEYQKVIFEKYERISSSKNVAGLGLGLYIARQIISHHQGTIHVESTPGHGATFTISLPLQTMKDHKISA